MNSCAKQLLTPSLAWLTLKEPSPQPLSGYAWATWDGRNQVLFDFCQSSNLFPDRSRQGLVSVCHHAFFFFFFFCNSGPPCCWFPKLTLPFISLFLPLAWLSDLTSWHWFCTCFLSTSPQLSAVLLFHLAWYCWTRYNCEDFCHIRELSRKQRKVIKENETKDRDVLRKGSFIIDERECESGWGRAIAALDQMDGI